MTEAIPISAEQWHEFRVKSAAEGLEAEQAILRFYTRRQVPNTPQSPVPKVDEIAAGTYEAEDGFWLDGEVLAPCPR